MIEGPEDHLDFIEPLLRSLVSMSCDVYYGWTGYSWKNERKIALFYRLGPVIDRLELLEHKFRRDIAFCDLMLSDQAILVIKSDGHVILRRTIKLPAELTENGTKMFPFSLEALEEMDFYEQ